MPDVPEITFPDQSLAIRFPGGASISASVPIAGAATNIELSKQLLAQATGALAPLKPVFDIIEFAVSVKDFAEAVPQLLTDPSAVIDAISALVENVADLAAIVPQLSVPLLILDLVDTILAFLTGMSEELSALAEQQTRIEQAQAIADEQGLDALAECVAAAEVQLQGQLESLAAGAGPIDSIIELINIFVGLIGLPEIPTLGGADTSSVTALAAQLEAFVGVLTSVRDTIPV